MRRLFALGVVPMLVVAAWFGNVGAAVLFGACVYAVLYRPTPVERPRRLGPLR